MNNTPLTLATVENDDCVVVINLAKLTNAVFFKSSGTFKMYFAGTKEEVNLSGEAAVSMLSFLSVRAFRVIKAAPHKENGNSRSTNKK